VNTKTYYLLDVARCFAFAGQAREYADDPGVYNVPNDAVLVEPPPAPAGSVARWTGEGWQIVEDHRRATLYLPDGQTYPIGSDADGQTYDGLGAIPAWLADAPPPPAPPTPEQIQQRMTGLMQAHLDDTAKTRGYDGILSLCSYYGSANPQFAAEAKAGMAFRDSVWAYGYQVLAEVQAGARGIPSDDDLLAELPAIEWPA